MESKRERFEEQITFRLFSDEREKISKITKYATNIINERKYENESHFIRCAVIQLINEEKKKLESIKGRPKKVTK